MGMKLIGIGNIIVMQYLITSHYKVPYKWAWLILTAAVLSALLIRKKEPPRN